MALAIEKCGIGSELENSLELESDLNPIRLWDNILAKMSQFIKISDEFCHTLVYNGLQCIVTNNQYLLLLDKN